MESLGIAGIVSHPAEVTAKYNKLLNQIGAEGMLIRIESWFDTDELIDLISCIEDHLLENDITPYKTDAAVSAKNNMPNFIELETPPFGAGFPKSYAEKNGIFEPQKAYVNVDHIASIERYIGDMIHEGWDCCKVITKSGCKFIDKRSPEELLVAISS